MLVSAPALLPQSLDNGLDERFHLFWPAVAVAASPLARAAFAIYALLLAYSGLAPWSGWRDLGLNPFAYLAAPIPAHVTNFDLAVNVLAYMPFGALLVLALHPVARGWTVVLIALLSAMLLARRDRSNRRVFCRRVFRPTSIC